MSSLTDAAGPLPAVAAAADPAAGPKWLNQDANLSPALRQVVAAYRPQDNAYVTKKYKSYILFQPIFPGEKEYTAMQYPSPESRLLALFRFWNVIEYYYPHKNDLSQDWTRVLNRYAPAFAQAPDTLSYHQLCRKLSAELHDSHAAAASKIISRRQDDAGAPFATACLKGQMVVTRPYADSPVRAANIQPGDVITHLNGQAVKAARAALRPYVSASTVGALERDISLQLLSGAAGSTMRLTLQRGSQTV